MPQITDQAAEQNREAWDSFRRQRDEGLVNIRPNSAGDILAGKRFLYPENLELVGNVRGKRLLDMGCGDGAEMLEWARAGAIVTGVDNSPVQLASARRNAERLGVECRLVQADLLNLPDDLLQGEFDIVFSAWVESWIGDLDGWFGSAWRALKPGGRFLLNGGHPISNYVQAVEQGDTLRDSYFDEGPYFLDEASGDPCNPPGDPSNPVTTIEWGHTLSSLVTAVARAGLRIDALLELPDTDETSSDYGIEYGVKGRPGRIILAATKTGEK